MFGKSKEKTLADRIVDFLTDSDGKYIYQFDIDGVDVYAKTIRLELLPRDMFILELEDGTEFMLHLSKLGIRRSLMNK